ncbi:hypothetical protein Scep_016371 [Stephania cephalantha]|uniref:Uncharacterized protein n=1 Tax=Stephania cephalantha TaxID=152367 RepID=A0AAP0INP8_9MAGN
MSHHFFLLASAALDAPRDTLQCGLPDFLTALCEPSSSPPLLPGGALSFTGTSPAASSTNPNAPIQRFPFSSPISY